eukprot:8774233-Heterocapsa_arctica.AAC.1
MPTGRRRRLINSREIRYCSGQLGPDRDRVGMWAALEFTKLSSEIFFCRLGSLVLPSSRDGDQVPLRGAGLSNAFRRCGDNADTA